MRIELGGGSYVARSIIANCQRCINLYPEGNPKDSPVPVTYYQRPGFRPVASDPTNLKPVRGLYQASNDAGYAVIGQKVYRVQPDWTLKFLGLLVNTRTNPVSMADNGNVVMLVDGSGLGYKWDLKTETFSQIVDPTGIFTGATRLGVLDLFLLWNIPDTYSFGSTLFNQLTFDPTYFAGKTSYPDKLVSLTVNSLYLLLLGTQTGEVWYDVGGPAFPFARLPGANIEHGCAAPYSLASQDISSYWLVKGRQGKGIVMEFSGSRTRRISDHALEYAISQMADVSDAIGYTYQQGGHVFYVLVFPSADATWAYDVATQHWTQRCWTDGDGMLHRDRSNCAAVINGENVVGDWENGELYVLDQVALGDIVAGKSYGIRYIRTFPHVSLGIAANGQPVLAEGKRLQFHKFVADLECGASPLGPDGLPARVGLRWSLDRGRTFGETVLRSAGAPGEFLTQPIWQPIGIGRDVVFEISHSITGPAALNGAWVEATVLES